MTTPTDTERLDALAAGLSRIVVYEKPEDKKRRCRIDVRPPVGKVAGISGDFLRLVADGLIQSRKAVVRRTSE